MQAVTNEVEKAIILALVKIVAQPDHAVDVLEGRLYMNQLSRFADTADDLHPLRTDRYEGVSAWLQPGNWEFKFNDIVIPSGDIIAPIAIQATHALTRNVFCMFSLNSRGVEKFDSDDLARVRRKVEIPEECFALGDHCVVLHNPHEFITRTGKAMKAKGLGAHLNLVDYFDEQSFDGVIANSRPGFAKRSTYAYQREYRIVVDDPHATPGPFVLEVGNLGDIAYITTPREFNESLTFTSPDGISF